MQYSEVIQEKVVRLSEVRRILQKTYERSHHFNKDRVFDEILFIFFSWRTPIAKAEAIYQTLKSRFSDWNELFTLTKDEWFEILETGGKARDKARTIVKLLGKLREDFGEIEHIENLVRQTDLEIYDFGFIAGDQG